jgi:hypothetical protein
MLPRTRRHRRQTRHRLFLNKLLSTLEQPHEALDELLEPFAELGRRRVVVVVGVDAVAEVDEGSGGVAVNAGEGVGERGVEHGEDLGGKEGLDDKLQKEEEGKKQGKSAGGAWKKGRREIGIDLEVGTELADAVDKGISDSRMRVVDQRANELHDLPQLRLHQLGRAFRDRGDRATFGGHEKGIVSCSSPDIRRPEDGMNESSHETSIPTLPIPSYTRAQQTLDHRPEHRQQTLASQRVRHPVQHLLSPDAPSSILLILIDVLLSPILLILQSSHKLDRSLASSIDRVDRSSRTRRRSG